MMTAPSPLLHFEDFHPGQTFVFGHYAVSREEIVEFAGEFDPQPHHLDDDAGKRSLLGGLAASGWHVCAMAMRMVVDGLIVKAANRGGVGADECRWMKPVRPGDILRVEVEVLETRASTSRSDIGFVHVACRIFNQREQVALLAMTPILARRRA
ncbi:MAG TPA: MaoC family dehydratase [Rhizomicrobium sp.]